MWGLVFPMHKTHSSKVGIYGICSFLPHCLWPCSSLKSTLSSLWFQSAKEKQMMLDQPPLTADELCTVIDLAFIAYPTLILGGLSRSELSEKFIFSERVSSWGDSTFLDEKLHNMVGKCSPVKAGVGNPMICQNQDVLYSQKGEILVGNSHHFQWATTDGIPAETGSLPKDYWQCQRRSACGFYP